jgi:hypothetical protein
MKGNKSHKQNGGTNTLIVERNISSPSIKKTGKEMYVDIRRERKTLEPVWKIMLT